VKKENSDLSGATADPESKSTGGKGPWMREVERKLSEAISIGVRSSGKAKTREYHPINSDLP
jgi:hypothetical protein